MGISQACLDNVLRLLTCAGAGAMPLPTPKHAVASRSESACRPNVYPLRARMLSATLLSSLVRRAARSLLETLGQWLGLCHPGCRCLSAPARVWHHVTPSRPRSADDSTPPQSPAGGRCLPRGWRLWSPSMMKPTAVQDGRVADNMLLIHCGPRQWMVYIRNVIHTC